ncbi:cupin domain-containing protein [Catenovulum sp. 2E275]|uniref:cupin domain-containing protein n=1 Tax=Catenovulum sp. 2E275 TaxID=2980497 RepID=UPI0021CE7819|nr:cupin domain-containing protein [Catenovulum sp. 2E275]MCU4676558.1 cupin domain-containing protein [Catenovulum sp. 2E275]
MLLNADFSKNVSLKPNQFEWSKSPQAGVNRIMLDRIGNEKARATSIVEYQPDSNFAQHLHPGGEEILVLHGVFSDENGDYPAGWYLRNPPGSSHQPFSQTGARIFVKLRQMDSSDTQTVKINTQDPSLWQTTNSINSCLLYQSDTETVSLLKLKPTQTINLLNNQNAEILVVSGALRTKQADFPNGSWLRLANPNASPICATEQGAVIYLKLGQFKNCEIADYK